ncbi:hypothetical protein VFPBJ_08024 [Purpureocillium lilacinum]|uniref:Uncharacterized protein n=1 Tax=Purpureocillium lilacinum TaxID=33203 RepID=A0A179GI99_PURLI|nr:hypothetical protein VFPBJ_08024 [Purpureocillium lilacinum]
MRRVAHPAGGSHHARPPARPFLPAAVLGSRRERERAGDEISGGAVLPAGVIPQDGVLVSSRPRLNSALGEGGECCDARAAWDSTVGTVKAGRQAGQKECRRKWAQGSGWLASPSPPSSSCCAVWGVPFGLGTGTEIQPTRVDCGACLGSTRCVCVYFEVGESGGRERERLVPDWHACTRTVTYTTATVPLWKG